LRDDKFLQRVYIHASTDASLDSGKARVIPAVHELLLHEPIEFPLGQHSVDEVDLAIGHDVHVSEAQSSCNPLELLVTAMKQEREGREETYREIETEKEVSCELRESRKREREGGRNTHNTTQSIITSHHTSSTPASLSKV
jgi:hypothetical protein